MRKAKLFCLVFVPLLLFTSIPFATHRKVDATTVHTILPICDFNYSISDVNAGRSHWDGEAEHGINNAPGYAVDIGMPNAPYVQNINGVQIVEPRLTCSGSNIYAGISGTAYLLGDGCGSTMLEIHNSTLGIKVRYLHGNYSVGNGSQVSAGQVVGSAGANGCADGYVHNHINVMSLSTGSSLTYSSDHSLLANQWQFGSGNRFFQTMRGTDNGIWTRQNITDTTWGTWVRTGETLGNIDTEEYLGTTLQAMRGTDNLVYTRQYEGGAWEPWSVDGMIETSGDVEIEIFNNKVYQAVRGNDNVVRTRKAAGDLDFGNWYYGGNMMNAYSKVTMEVHDGKLWQFVRGANDNIFYRSSSDGLFTDGWTQLGALKVRDDLEAHSYNGTLYVTARGMGNEAYILKYANNVSWVLSYEGGTRSAIYMEQFENKLYLTMRGTDNRVYTKTIDNVNGVTIPWNYNTGGGETHAQPTFGLYNGRLFQSIRGTDNRIYTRYTWQDQSWTGWVLHDTGETVSEISM